MKSLRIFFTIIFLSCLVFPFGAWAVIDNNAPAVKYRYDDPAKPDDGCIEGGLPINNCFTQFSSPALMNWIKNTRNPTSTAPLLVDIGPGTFGRLNWVCAPGQGHVTFRGAGRGKTIFSDSNILGSAFTFQGCNTLAFENLTVSAKFISVTWMATGSSTWTNVELLAGYAAWYESEADSPSSGTVCPLGEQGTHKFFSSTLTTTNPSIGALGFLNVCGKNWFWGSEIVLDAPAATYTGGGGGIASNGAGNEVHLYGSNLRLFSGNGSAISSLTAVTAVNGAEVHIHGTGIDVISMTGKNIIVLSAANGGEIHADESAYVLKTSAPGTVTRINNNNGTGHIHAPYLWQHIPDPATVPGFTSVNGADITTETVGVDVNLLVYNSQCTGSGGPWYNVALRTCR